MTGPSAFVATTGPSARGGQNRGSLGRGAHRAEAAKAASPSSFLDKLSGAFVPLASKTKQSVRAAAVVLGDARGRASSVMSSGWSKAAELSGAVKMKVQDASSASLAVISDVVTRTIWIATETSSWTGRARTAVIDRSSSMLSAVGTSAAAVRDQTMGTISVVLQKALDAKTRTAETAAVTQAKTAEMALSTKKAAVEAASDPAVQVTAMSAGAGAVAVGAGCAATGLFAGGATGLAVGLPLAPFTMGLSVPVGAVVGAASGLFTGAAAGGAAGLIGGGAVGYGAYSRRAQLKEGLDEASSYATRAMDHAHNSVNFVKRRFGSSDEPKNTVAASCEADGGQQ